MKFVYRKQEYESEYTRQEFESICSPLIKRLRFPVERALKDASLSVDDLNAIILVGGASRMPLVRSLTAKMLGKLPYGHINPDEVVALGAAVQAGLVSRQAGLEDVVLTDVAPYSLGTGIVNPASDDPNDLLYHPIIERNSPVPLSRSDTLYTVRDYQTRIRIDVYQGESRLARDNIKLGEIELPVPKARAGEQSIEVRFTYDISGLLEVEGKVIQTGHQERITIEGNPGVMTPKEIETRLKELSHLKVHPRDKIENTALIARAERLYQESLGELRQYIQTLISEFEKILNGQIPSEIEQARKKFSELLDEVEFQRGF